MNKYQCRDLADNITEEEIMKMFESAKLGIKDWTKVSRINKGFSKGAAWNILHGCYTDVKFNLLSGLAKRNMIFEFQEFLPGHLIPKEKLKINTEIEIMHQEPKF